MSNIVRLILIGILLFLSFFFASAESAYTSVNKLKIEKDVENNKRYSNVIKKIVDHYDNTVLTVLLGNNIVNITMTALVTGLGLNYAGGQYVALFAAILFVILVIFGEIIPKTMGVKFNYTLVYLYIFPYVFFYYLFTPLLFLFRLFNGRIHRKKHKIEGEDGNYTEDELQIIVDEFEEEGLIDEATSDLVRNAIEFTETEAYQIMTPRVDVFSFDIDDSVSNLLKQEDVFKYSRIPVYQDTIDNIIGILSTKDLLRLILTKNKISVRSLIKPALFVHHTKNISHILTEFKQTKNHIAIVIDEYGGTEGIVTMEDILEEVIGEIWDESDDVNEPIIQKGEGHYIIDGGLNIEDFFALFDLEEDEDNDYDTVAGWCLEMLDRFAKKGDRFTYQNISVTILKIDGFVVDKVEVRVIKEE